MTELRPLGGHAVVEIGDGHALALCGKLLADAGADVTRVVRVGDSPGRRRFADLGKTIVELDLDAPRDRGLLEELLGGASLYLSSLEPAYAAPRTLDCAAVLARHDGIAAAALTPFGEAGPYAGFASDDVVLSALAGLADATPGIPDRCPPGEPPVQCRAPLAECGAAFMAAYAILGALTPRLRGQPGGARHVEVALLEAVVAQMAYEWGMSAYGGAPSGRHTTHMDLEPNVYLPCADGMVVIVAFADPHWAGLVEMMGSPAWAAQPEFANAHERAAHHEELHARLRAWTLGMRGADFLEGAQQRGMPCCCALGLTETLASEQIRVMASTRALDDGSLVAADPVRVDGARREPARPGQREPAAADGHATAGVVAQPAQPLAGVRVLDLSQIVAGPFAGQLLAALGADVVLVESRRRLVSRSFGPFAGDPAHDASAMFNQINQSKRSVQIDLTTDAGRELLGDLVAASDVVLENFSGRAARALGLDHASLKALRPDVILASISGFGREGPWREYVALHSGVILLSGLADVTRDERGAMRLAGAIYPDVLTGTYMAFAIAQALSARERGGGGCHLEVSMLDVMLTCMGDLVTGAAAAAVGEPTAPSPARFLRCAEPGRFVALSNPAVAADELAGLTRREAMEQLQARGIAAAAVLDMTEVIADPHLAERGFVRADDHPVAGTHPIPAVPWRYDGERPRLRHAPRLGAATDEVLAERTSRDRDEIARLHEQEVLV